MQDNIDIIKAIEDPELFGSLFKDQSTWAAWKVALKAIFALPMTKEELKTYRQFTDRKKPIKQQFQEIFLIIGRRGGKSIISAIIACYLALFYDWRPYLSPGETGTIMCIATDRRQAQVVMGYVKAILELRPWTLDGKKLVNQILADEVRLNNQISITVKTCDYRTLRGFTVVAAICDEVAFWRSEGVNPAEEILTAIRPSLATVPGSMLLGISTPYSKAGPLHEAFRNIYSQDDPYSLVWKATSKEMNPTIPDRIIKKALKDDYSAAKAEWLAEFRDDLETMFTSEMIEDAIEKKRYERPRIDGACYQAFCDFSSGRKDSSVLAIAHRDEEDGKIVLDRIKEKRPPFKPADVIEEFSKILEEYSVDLIQADKYAIGYVQEVVENLGLAFEPSALNKAEIYLEFEPLLAQGQVILLDNERMFHQLRSLERRTRSGGRDSVDHPKGLHDDIANAVSGACVLAAKEESQDWEIMVL